MKPLNNIPKIRTKKTIRDGAIVYIGESQLPGADDNDQIWRIERIIPGQLTDISDFAGVDKFNAVLADRNDGITFPPPVIGSIFALEYDGLNDDVVIADATLLKLEFDQPFTIAIWVDMPSSATVRIIFSKLEASSLGYEINIGTTNKIRIQMSNNFGARAVVETTNAQSGRMHIVVTNSGSGLASGLNITVNNVLQAKTVIQDNLLGNTIVNLSSLIFGSRDGVASFADMIQDGTIIVNKLLSTVEISELYNGNIVTDARTLSFANDLIAQWRFEDKGLSGLIVEDINLLNGTMRNFADIDAAFVAGL